MASSSAPPTNKRRRSASPPPPRKMRDRCFYFDDGSIVLSAPGGEEDKVEAEYVGEDADQAMSPPGTANAADENIAEGGVLVYFRVHRSMLVGESEVFRDMFVVGQRSTSATNGEIYDGVPLITMYDKAKDIRGFLRAIYKPLAVFLPPYDPSSAKLLTSPLLLAVKYQADDLKRRIIEHLEADWPGLDYDEWKSRTAKIDSCGDIPNPEDFLELIRTVNMPDDLKKPRAVALYIMLCYSTGTYVASALEVKDCLALMAGRSNINTLFWQWVKMAKPVTTVDADTGAVSLVPILTVLQECQKCKLKAFRDKLLIKWVESSMDTADVLAFLEKEAKGISEGYGATLLCSQRCRKDAGEWLETLAGAFYGRLEEIFEIPDENAEEATG